MALEVAHQIRSVELLGLIPRADVEALIDVDRAIGRAALLWHFMIASALNAALSGVSGAVGKARNTSCRDGVTHRARRVPGSASDSSVTTSNSSITTQRRRG